MSDRYAVIGNPIGHSKSPLIHGLFARSTGQDMRYEALFAPLDGFSAAVDSFRAQGARGLNITVPFKLEALAYATEASEDARLVGAANALKFDGTHVAAENFDGVGLVRDLVHNLGCPVAGQRVLLLGAGGATRGAVLPLLREGPAVVVIANRTVAKAVEVARLFGAHQRVEACGYNDLRGDGFDFVINATSASLSGVCPPVPASVYRHNTLAYEMVYGKGMTPFLLAARQAGCARCVDGVGMLVEQAAEAFAWWRGVRPDTRGVIEQITVPLV